jgi:hypothetical protein
MGFFFNCKFAYRLYHPYAHVLLTPYPKPRQGLESRGLPLPPCRSRCKYEKWSARLTRWRCPEAVGRLTVRCTVDLVLMNPTVRSSPNEEPNVRIRLSAEEHVIDLAIPNHPRKAAEHTVAGGGREGVVPRMGDRLRWCKGPMSGEATYYDSLLGGGCSFGLFAM